MSQPLPPDTRVAGQGNPPADMDEVVDALTEMGETRTVKPSGDVTGVTDAALVNSLAAAFGSAGGTILMAPGTYYWAAGTIVISHAGVSIRHLGSKWACTVNAVGTGDILRMYSTANYLSGWGGGCEGFTIDGTNAGAGSCGIHAGDIYQLKWDCGVRNFQGAGSKGFWFDSQYWYAEGMHGRIWAELNTSNVVFDQSANAGGNAGGSFARMVLDIYLDMKGFGDGVIFQNGAFTYNHNLGIYGNCDYGAAQHYVLQLLGPNSFSFTATNASPCVFTAAGSYYTNGTPVTISGGSLPTGFTAGVWYVVNASGATFQLAATSGGAAVNSTSTGSGTVIGYPYSSIFAGTTRIGVECNSTSAAFQPITINFGSQGNNVLSGSGIIDFSAGKPLAGAVNWNGSFEFDGPCTGDVNLKRVTGVGAQIYSEGPLSNGAFITTRWTALATANPAAPINGLILGAGGGDNGGNYYFTLVNFGAGSMTFAPQATSRVATGAACVIQPGTCMTFQWLTTGVWYPITSQNQDGMFGDASDGAATLDGTVTVGWAGKVGSVYTMSRDIYMTSLTVNTGVTLITNGWRIFCQAVLSGAGIISCNGGNAAGAAAGASPVTSLNCALAGNIGAAGATGVGAQGAFTGLFGATGGVGAGGTGTAGAGGAARGARAGITTGIYRHPAGMQCCSYGFGNSILQIGGSPGGSAGAGDSTNSGGGGGGGGGVIAIFAASVTGTLALAANGGNGGTPPTGNCGGGSAGGGGLIIGYTLSPWTVGSTSVTAGSAGAGVGTGTAGSASTAGSVLNVIIQ